MKQITLGCVLVACSALMAENAQAQLFDRGGGLLYDDVLNITWLQDANYAKTSGHDADGWMYWHEAKAWVADLVYHDTLRGVSYSDWRLPKLSPVNGATFQYMSSNDGSTDWGYNNTSPHSELSYMYYVNLGLKGYRDVTGAVQPDWGIFGDGSEDGHDGNDGWWDQNDVGPVKNLQAAWYWTDTEFAPDPLDDAWTLMFADGNQMATQKLSYYTHVWAVRDGDVGAPVPLPGAMWLFGSALMGFLCIGRSTNTKSRSA